MRHSKDEIMKILDRNRGGQWHPNTFEWAGIASVLSIFIGAVIFVLCVCLL